MISPQPETAKRNNGSQVYPPPSTYEIRQSVQQQHLLKRIARFTRRLFPRLAVDVSSIHKLVAEAYDSTSDEEYGELEALEWAEGFRFPPDIACNQRFPGL